MKDIMSDELGAPAIVDRTTFQVELDALRVREKAHTREGDAKRGLHLGHLSGPRAVLHPFSRRDLRHFLPRPVRRERPVPRLHGLGDALVLGSRLARHPSGLDAE